MDWPSVPGSECPDCGHSELEETGVTHERRFRFKCGKSNCRAEWVGALIPDDHSWYFEDGVPF